MSSKKKEDDISIGMLYESIINLQIDIAKLKTDMYWVKKILYALIGIAFSALLAVILK
jgi:hypothetical protein